MSNNNDCAEAAPRYTVSVKLTPSAIESMRCLFLHGPTWDGNIPSKSGRNELFDLKLATRIEGWSWLTADGMRMALANGLDRDKERWERDRRRKMIKLDEIERIVLPPPAGEANQKAPAVACGNPVMHGMERYGPCKQPEGHEGECDPPPSNGGDSQT